MSPLEMGGVGEHSMAVHIIYNLYRIAGKLLDENVCQWFSLIYTANITLIINAKRLLFCINFKSTNKGISTQLYSLEYTRYSSHNYVHNL